VEDPTHEGDDNALDAISNRVEILVQKKLGSHADDEFEAKLREARSRPYLRLSDLSVLLESKGADPRDAKSRKDKLEAWEAVKDATVTWQRTSSWNEGDEEELLKLQNSLE
jgi:hypothetical protein